MREKVSWAFAQVVFWACLSLGVTVSGLTSFWGGMALIGVALVVPILKAWPNALRRLQGKPAPSEVDPLRSEIALLRADLARVHAQIVPAANKKASPQVRELSRQERQLDSLVRGGYGAEYIAPVMAAIRQQMINIAGDQAPLPPSRGADPDYPQRP